MAAAAAHTGALAFSAKTARPETLTTSGCSYVTAAKTAQINVETDPGSPAQVVFGSAANLRITPLPKLGSGAESAVSATFCALVVPERGGNTIQVEVIGNSAAPVAAPCKDLTQLAKQFATPPATK